MCKGTLTFGQSALDKVGISIERLAAGTPCLIADFDGNGSDDIAFVDDRFTDPKLAAQVQVLLFDQVGLMATSMLPKRVQSLGLAPLQDGRTALVEPGPAAERFRFVYRDGRFHFEVIPRGEGR